MGMEALIPIGVALVGGAFSMLTKPDAPSMTPAPTAPTPPAEETSDSNGLLAAESAKARSIARAQGDAYKAGTQESLNSTKLDSLAKKTLLGS